jgi:hypothetical protein
MGGATKDVHEVQGMMLIKCELVYSLGAREDIVFGARGFRMPVRFSVWNAPKLPFFSM